MTAIEIQYPALFKGCRETTGKISRQLHVHGPVGTVSIQEVVPTLLFVGQSSLTVNSKHEFKVKL